jgi:hypothetical protein
MATAQTAATSATKSAKTKTAPPTAAATELAKKRALRRRTRADHRKKLSAKLKTDKEFAKGYFDARSKRAIEKKAAFRKKKSKKK